ACLSASSIAGKSRGSFFISASSAAMYRLRDGCIPAQLAADSPQLAFIAHIDRLSQSNYPSRTRENFGEGIRAERTEPNTLILPTPLVREWRQKCPNELLICFRRTPRLHHKRSPHLPSAIRRKLAAREFCARFVRSAAASADRNTTL